MQTRSFCYVDDLIEGFMKLFFADRIYEPVNIGNPQPITMLELAAEIIQLTNSSSKIVFKPLPGDDPKDRRPDISKAKKLLAWEPTISRDSGLKKTIENFRSRI
jgi:UDP-glucuronate decarboxylase